MFGALKEIIANLSTEPRADEDRTKRDRQLAAAALLFHVADLDGIIHPDEKSRLRSLISERFGLDAGQTSRLVAQAEAVDHEAVDLYRFTSVLNRALDHEGRLQVVEMMWDMAYADGKPNELEETTVWRVAELMGVTTRERVELRQKVSRLTAAGGQPSGEAFVSPWTEPEPER